MGKFDGNGFMGFSGKAGGLVSYYLNGQRVVRQVGYPSKPPTVAQIAQRERIKVISKFLKPLKVFFNVGFRLAVKRTTKNEYNEAVSYASLALEGEYPNFSINYSKVILSKGDLKNPENLALSFLDKTAVITWTAHDPIWNRPGDRAMMAFYFPELENAIVFLSGPERKDCRIAVDLPASHLNKQMIVYIAFQSSDTKQISQSVYLGDHRTPAA